MATNRLDTSADAAGPVGEESFFFDGTRVPGGDVVGVRDPAAVARSVYRMQPFPLPPGGFSVAVCVTVNEQRALRLHDPEAPDARAIDHQFAFVRHEHREDGRVRDAWWEAHPLCDPHARLGRLRRGGFATLLSERQRHYPGARTDGVSFRFRLVHIHGDVIRECHVNTEPPQEGAWRLVSVDDSEPLKFAFSFALQEWEAGRGSAVGVHSRAGIDKLESTGGNFSFSACAAASLHRSGDYAAGFSPSNSTSASPPGSIRPRRVRGDAAVDEHKTIPQNIKLQVSTTIRLQLDLGDHAAPVKSVAQLRQYALPGAQRPHQDAMASHDPVRRAARARQLACDAALRRMLPFSELGSYLQHLACCGQVPPGTAHVHAMPRIASIVSGGGWRAMASAVHFFDALKASDLTDCIHTVAGLSGGAWATVLSLMVDGGTNQFGSTAFDAGPPPTAEELPPHLAAMMNESHCRWAVDKVAEGGHISWLSRVSAAVGMLLCKVHRDLDNGEELGRSILCNSERTMLLNYKVLLYHLFQDDEAIFDPVRRDATMNRQPSQSDDPTKPLAFAAVNSCTFREPGDHDATKYGHPHLWHAFDGFGDGGGTQYLGYPRVPLNDLCVRHTVPESDHAPRTEMNLPVSVSSVLAFCGSALAAVRNAATYIDGEGFVGQINDARTDRHYANLKDAGLDCNLPFPIVTHGVGGCGPSDVVFCLDSSAQVVHLPIELVVAIGKGYWRGIVYADSTGLTKPFEKGEVRVFFPAPNSGHPVLIYGFGDTASPTMKMFRTPEELKATRLDVFSVAEQMKAAFEWLLRLDLLDVPTSGYRAFTPPPPDAARRCDSAPDLLRRNTEAPAPKPPRAAGAREGQEPQPAGGGGAGGMLGARKNSGMPLAFVDPREIARATAEAAAHRLRAQRASVVSNASTVTGSPDGVECTRAGSFASAQRSQYTFYTNDSNIADAESQSFDRCADLAASGGGGGEDGNDQLIPSSPAPRPPTTQPQAPPLAQPALDPATLHAAGTASVGWGSAGDLAASPDALATTRAAAASNSFMGSGSGEIAARRGTPSPRALLDCVAHEDAAMSTQPTVASEQAAAAAAAAPHHQDDADESLAVAQTSFADLPTASFYALVDPLALTTPQLGRGGAAFTAAPGDFSAPETPAVASEEGMQRAWTATEVGPGSPREAAGDVGVRSWGDAATAAAAVPPPTTTPATPATAASATTSSSASGAVVARADDISDLLSLIRTMRDDQQRVQQQLASQTAAIDELRAQVQQQQQQQQQDRQESMAGL